MSNQGIIDEFEQQLKNDFDNWSIILEAMNALRKLPEMQESKDFQILNFHLEKVENTTQYLQFLSIINPRNRFAQNRKRKIKPDSDDDLDEIKDVMPIRCDKENTIEPVVTPIYVKRKPVLTDEQMALILNLPVPARPVLKDSQQQPQVPAVVSLSPQQLQIQVEPMGPYEVMRHNEKGTKNKPHLVAVFYGKGCPGENPKFYLNVDGIIRGASVRRLNADRQVILACGRQYSANGMCEARTKLRLRDAYNMTVKTDKKIILNVNSPAIRDINNYEVVECESPEHICTQYVHYLDIKRVAKGELSLKDFLKEYRAKPTSKHKNANNNKSLFAAHLCQDLPTLLPHYSDLASETQEMTDQNVEEPRGVAPPKFERCQSVIVANPKQEAFKDSPGTSSDLPY